MKKEKILFILVIVEAVVIFLLAMGNLMDSKTPFANFRFEEPCSLLNCTAADCTFEECAIHDIPVTIANLEKAEKAVVDYSPNAYVNFRSEPKNGKKYIKYQINNGSIVEILEDGEDYTKVNYEDDIGYIVNESFEKISSQRVIFDVSDYQWGSEYSSKEEFKEFTRNALKNCNFGGYYIQVRNYNKESKYWKTTVEACEEMRIPYGLYFYTAAVTRDAIEIDYNRFKELCNSMDMEYNLLPLMVDLEKAGNQIEVIKYLNDICGDNYILYAGANDIVTYHYNEYAKSIWVAHYGLTDSAIPNSPYEGRNGSKQGFIPMVWQYTDKGNKLLFDTNHLDLNIVNEEWYRSYVK